MQNGTLWICIADGQWWNDETGEPISGPRKDEILTECGRLRKNYLVFEEYPGVDERGEPHGWRIDHFCKLQDPLNINIESLISEPA